MTFSLVEGKSLKVTRMDGDNAFLEALNVRGQILILKKRL